VNEVNGMTCESVQERISSLVDGMLSSEERDNVLAHMDACRSCGARSKAAQTLRASLRRLDRAPIPATLAMQLRVLASHERVRQLARASYSTRILYWASRVRLQVDNLMRPFAVPVAGGVLSALLLFGVLVSNLSFRHTFTTEPPLSLSSDPDGRIVDWMGVLPRLEPVNSVVTGDATVVELTIDDHGRVADYEVRQGRLTPAIKDFILLSTFTPATFFYQRVWGKKLAVFPSTPSARG